MKRMKGLKGVQSSHNNSHQVIGTTRLGKLIPVFWQIVPPRSRLNISQALEVLLEPTIRPLKTTIEVFLHTWKVPLRLLWGDGSSDYDKTRSRNVDSYVAFITDPDSGKIPPYISAGDSAGQLVDVRKSLIDYFGYPVVCVEPAGTSNQSWRYEESQVLKASAYLPRAYQRIVYDWYRHPEYQGLEAYSLYPDQYVLPRTHGGAENIRNPAGEIIGSYLPINRNWNQDDYFMQILPSAQKGAAVFIPSAGGTIRDLTLAEQMQNFKEDLNVGGSTRLNEFLLTQFGVAPSDATLQRSVYLGGGRGIVNQPQVVQTSQTTESSPQANRAGLGVSLTASNRINHFFDEECVVVTLMSVMPRRSTSQGLDKMFNIETITDHVLPIFNYLGDRAVTQKEISTNGVLPAHLNTVRGYIGMREEYRRRQDRYCGEMRPEAGANQAYWHLGVYFSPGSVNVNSDFIRCLPDESRVFSVPSRDTVNYHVYNRVYASLPIPKTARPGFGDHK